MKAWKIFAVIAFAFIAVALITTSALAHYPSGQGISGSYGSNGAAQGSNSGMMRGPMQGPMGWGYSPSSVYPQQNSTEGQYGSWAGGCGMRNGRP
jgi:hypothetical protein